MSQIDEILYHGHTYNMQLVNSLVVVVVRRAMASTAMLLSEFAQNIRVSAPEGLNSWQLSHIFPTLTSYGVYILSIVEKVTVSFWGLAFCVKSHLKWHI